MNRNEIRQLNLNLLIEEAGTVIELAASTGLTRGTIQHYKSGFRNIGDDGARRLEEGMSKPLGWLDVEHIPNHHKVAAADVHNRLLRLPQAVTDVIALLLHVIENPRGQGEASGGVQSVTKPRTGKSKGQVIILKDNDAKNRASERDSSDPKRRR